VAYLVWRPSTIKRGKKAPKEGPRKVDDVVLRSFPKIHVVFLL